MIVRIEHQTTEAMLRTALLIGNGLRISIDEIARSLLGEYVAIPAVGQNPGAARDVLTTQDVSDALIAFQRNPEECIIWFAEILNGIERTVSNGSSRVVFTPGGVSLLVEEAALYTAVLQYPRESRWAPEDVVAIYCNGGVLTFEDVRMYVALLKHKWLGARNKPSNFDAAPHFLSNSPDHIRLKQVLQLDESLKQGGLALALCWQAMQFHLDFTSRYVVSSKQEEIAASRARRWIASFVLACRWIEQVCPPEQFWLSPLRAKLKELTSQHRISSAV